MICEIHHRGYHSSPISANEHSEQHNAHQDDCWVHLGARIWKGEKRMRMCLQIVRRVRDSEGESWRLTLWRSRQICPNHSFPTSHAMFSPSMSGISLENYAYIIQYCVILLHKHFPSKYSRGSLLFVHLYALFLGYYHCIGSFKWWQGFTLVPWFQFQVSINVVCFLFFFF